VFEPCSSAYGFAGPPRPNTATLADTKARLRCAIATLSSALLLGHASFRSNPQDRHVSFRWALSYDVYVFVT
jgi:hypothetical protein